MGRTRRLERTKKPVLVKIEEIHVPKKDYPPTHQFPPISPRFEELKRHMKKHGQLVPVFLDRDKILIQGHYRLWAWQELGETFVKALIVLDEKEIAEYFI